MDELNSVLIEHNMYKARHASRVNPTKGTVPFSLDNMQQIPRKGRHSGFETYFLKSPDFPERSLIIDCVRELFGVQQLPSTHGVPSLQDALTLLQVLLYRPTSDFANDVLQRAAAALCNALSELQSHQTRLAKRLAAKEALLLLQTSAAEVPLRIGQSPSRSRSSSMSLQQRSPQKQASASAEKVNENQKLAALHEEVDNLRQEMGALQLHLEMLNALLKRLDLLAERRSPGFVEGHMERLLRDGSFGRVFVSTHGNPIGRTSDGRMLLQNLSGEPTAVPRNAEELRQVLEDHVRNCLEQMAFEEREQYLRGKLLKMKACAHLITDLQKVTTSILSLSIENLTNKHLRLTVRQI